MRRTHLSVPGARPSGRFKVKNTRVVKWFTRFGLATLKRRKRRAPACLRRAPTLWTFGGAVSGMRPTGGAFRRGIDYIRGTAMMGHIYYAACLS